MKNISILGSTGSIGKQALSVITNMGYNVTALAAKSNLSLLEEQVREYKPEIVCIYDSSLFDELKNKLKDINVKVVTGMSGLIECATVKSTDIMLNSVVGMIGLQPTLAAIENHIDIALANKETLVTGGELVMKAAEKNGVNIYPVDSEHSAIFQSLQGNTMNKIKKIFLTASGGPFFGKTTKDLADVTVKDALNHPNWSMGAKITIDSATLMNKGLEMIEAAWLFDLSVEDIEVVVHRESIIHSAVEFEDNSVIAQMGVPDMKIPIQYALTYPNRYPCDVKRLSLFDIGKLTFNKADTDTFVCLKACMEAIKKGGLYPTMVNGANEQAVELFLDGRISFLEIGRLVYESLNICLDFDEITVENILEVERISRKYVLENANYLK